MTLHDRSVESGTSQSTGNQAHCASSREEGVLVRDPVLSLAVALRTASSLQQLGISISHNLQNK